MAYRGGGSVRGANNGFKRFNPSPTPGSKPGSGFESQFAELASYNSPSTKRQRTNSGTGGGVKIGGVGSSSRLSLAASRKSPLKFDFKSTRKGTVNSLQPPSAEPSPKVIFRPLLPSQKVAPAPVPPPIDDLWGDDDDGCDDLLLAVSQSINPGDDRFDDIPDEEELAAMSAMMEDDDFDDFEPPKPLVEKSVVSTALKLPKKPDVFKAPAPFKMPGSNSNSVEEVEKYKKMQIRAQGEASMLRGELEKQSQLHNEERVRFRKLESNIREQNQEEKKKLQSETAKVKTERDFLMQEMQQLKGKITQLEADKVKDLQELPPSKKRRALDPIRPERNSFPSDMDFKKTVTSKSSETQTEVKQRRKFTLKPVDKSKALTLAYSKVSRASSDVMKTLFEQPDMRCLRETVSKTLESSVEEISSNLPSLPSASTLSDLTSMISVYDSQISKESRSGVTEVCSKILRAMIKAKEVDLLEPILVLVSTTWTSELLSQDITSDIFSLLIDLAASNFIMDQLTGVTLKCFFRILSLVTSSSEHCTTLCKGPESDCALSMIIKILHSSIKHGLTDESAEAGCEAMSSWILFSLSMSHSPGWNGKCAHCTHGIIRCFSLFTSSQVERRIFKPDTSEAMSNRLVWALEALCQLQNRIASTPVWCGAFDKQAQVQRSYIWAMDRMSKMGLGERAGVMLKGLTMDVSANSQEMMDCGDK